MNRRFFLFFPLFLLPQNFSYSINPKEFLKDEKLEIRARNLSKNIRCLVCQNQSIDDSNSPLAKDLRNIIRDELKNGKSDKQILNFLVSKYGHFILMKPEFNLNTFILWSTPIWAGLIGLLLIYFSFKKNK